MSIISCLCREKALHKLHACSLRRRANQERVIESTFKNMEWRGYCREYKALVTAIQTRTNLRKN